MIVERVLKIVLLKQLAKICNYHAIEKLLKENLHWVGYFVGFELVRIIDPVDKSNILFLTVLCTRYPCRVYVHLRVHVHVEFMCIPL